MSLEYGEVEECSDDVYTESEDFPTAEENEEGVKIITTEMYDKFKDNLKDEYLDLVRFIDYSLEKNKFDRINFYKDYYSFSFKEKEEVVEEQPVTQSSTGSFAVNTTVSGLSSSYKERRNYDVEIYPSHVVIKVEYNSTLINGVDDLFDKYKERFFELYIKQEKQNVKSSLADIYNISGLDLKKSREDKINSVLK
jgi:hypothetical protein